MDICLYSHVDSVDHFSVFVSGMLAILMLGLLIFMYQKRQNCKKSRREAGFLKLNSRGDYADDDSDDILSDEDVILNGESNIHSGFLEGTTDSI